jgi:hypothetical protein
MRRPAARVFEQMGLRRSVHRATTARVTTTTTTTTITGQERSLDFPCGIYCRRTTDNLDISSSSGIDGRSEPVSDDGGSRGGNIVEVHDATRARRPTIITTTTGDPVIAHRQRREVSAEHGERERHRGKQGSEHTRRRGKKAHRLVRSITTAREMDNEQDER